MNAISPIVSNRTAARLRERGAYLSLAIRQRRLYWQYRKWAAEDEAAGDFAAYRKHMAEANRLRTGARWHIQHAKENTYG